ncbi:MAG TPA: thrombospondin type 3 repeat-containing protein [Myxococcota bacterium]|nr:thrombospondin type 3 repeat-containing protein [Myxococcota bacterium]
MSTSGDACDGDRDSDGWPNGDDNCPDVANTLQADLEGDGIGDLCEDDLDGDGVPDATDNCAFAANPDQADLDQDGPGDVCDADLDGDGAPNGQDNCARVPNPNRTDLDLDGVGDACSSDDDGDGSDDGVDNCPRVANPGQGDVDQDGLGDACDPDRDGDGVFDGSDNCLESQNADQRGLDRDGLGDACDEDRDGDEVPDLEDVCPDASDPEQVDFDGDGVGDACEDDQDADGVMDLEDECPGSGEVAVDPSNGCSIEQLCPCAGPRGTDDEWRNKNRYVSCVTQAARRLVKQRLMSAQERDATIASAQTGDCGYLPCEGRVLSADPSASGPVLVLEVTAFEPLRQAPAVPGVYAGETEILPDALGRYQVPFRDTDGSLIRDELEPRDLKRSSVPRGSIVVLRGEAGNYTLGLYGNLPARSRLGMTVVATVLDGERANERNQSFERQGDGLWSLIHTGRDEFISTPTAATLHMTVGRGNDLLKGRLCR